ncbi:MAG: DUF4250 domain-containing protein [Lachnospiraceae bacterium]|jgi:hypothetical protein|nr:DUF4250 domain-containing protein [Lachnospiraceae bacterium]
MFPKDPQMLLSVLNMKLRDLYSSLDDLCDDMDADKDEIINIMEEAGYHYDADQNAFK